MNPIKHSNIYQKVADKINHDVSDISDINKFFWKEVKKNMIELSTPSLYITGLGRFNIRQNKVFPAIEKYRRNLKYWKLVQPQGPVTIEYEKNYKLLSDMGNILKDEWERKKEYKNGRK